MLIGGKEGISVLGAKDRVPRIKVKDEGASTFLTDQCANLHFCSGPRVCE
jgi:hypothetical protein